MEFNSVKIEKITRSFCYFKKKNQINYKKGTNQSEKEVLWGFTKNLFFSIIHKRSRASTKD